MARGDLQTDFGDTYAPVAGMESIRIFFALATFHSFQILQADVSNAFLYGDTKQVRYFRLPVGHPKHGEGRIWASTKSLYGLREAPLVWFKVLKDFFLRFNYEQCPIERCICVKK